MSTADWKASERESRILDAAGLSSLDYILKHGIKVGPLSYQILLVPGLPDVAGTNDLCNESIVIEKNMSAMQQRITLAHEIGHAIWNLVFGDTDEATEEKQIRATAALWVQVLRENPAFMACITESN